MHNYLINVCVLGEETQIQACEVRLNWQVALPNVVAVTLTPSNQLVPRSGGGGAIVNRVHRFDKFVYPWFGARITCRGAPRSKTHPPLKVP